VLARPAAHPHRRDRRRRHWARIAGEPDLLTLGTFTGPAGTFRQTAELTKAQRDLLAKLKIPHPKKIIEATPASS
jgi:hypothetical protein